MQWPASMKVPTYGCHLQTDQHSGLEMVCHKGQPHEWTWPRMPWAGWVSTSGRRGGEHTSSSWWTRDEGAQSNWGLLWILLCSSRSSWHLVGKWSSSSTWSTCGHRCERQPRPLQAMMRDLTSATSWTRSSRWWWCWRTSWTWWRCTSWWWTWWWPDCKEIVIKITELLPWCRWTRSTWSCAIGSDGRTSGAYERSGGTGWRWRRRRRRGRTDGRRPTCGTWTCSPWIPCTSSSWSSPSARCHGWKVKWLWQVRQRRAWAGETGHRRLNKRGRDPQQQFSCRFGTL